MNSRAHLTKRVLTPTGVRHCPAVFSANKRVKPDIVLVDGQEEKHPEGNYYVEWRRGGKRIRLSVGKDPTEANAYLRRKEAELNARNRGVALAEVEEKKPEGRSLPLAIDDYLTDVALKQQINKPDNFGRHST